MSFHQTSCDIHLTPEQGQRRTSLVAICNNDEGSGLTSDIFLDDFLGNDNGHFIWGGKNVTLLYGLREVWELSSRAFTKWKEPSMSKYKLVFCQGR
ncbi:hypothetical protein AFLA_006706 [Aspergillus flavus NRRL3357]|nr:hypothetical protein AFLA_006706 [Aspergillus flavus NRRL3357]